jgi:hypothetical protein
LSMNWKMKIAHELEKEDCPWIGKGRLPMNWKNEDCPWIGKGRLPINWKRKIAHEMPGERYFLWPNYTYSRLCSHSTPKIYLILVLDDRWYDSWNPNMLFKPNNILVQTYFFETNNEQNSWRPFSRLGMSYLSKSDGNFL